jgi:hypothetical protein
MAVMPQPDSTPRATVAKGAVKTSTLAGQGGVLGGQHAGGHSDVSSSKFGVTYAQGIKNAQNDPVIKQLEANQKKYMPGAKTVTSMTPVKKSK